MFQKIRPHLIAIVSFLALSIILFPSALQNQVVVQPDIVIHKGADNETNAYRKKTGNIALWNNSLFSGMPAFFTSGTFYKNQLSKVHKIASLYLARPVGAFFVGMVCMYILMLVLGVSPGLSAIGAFGATLASYNFIIYEVGHVNKLMVIIYFPLVTAGLIAIFKEKYLLGGGLFGLGLGLAIYGNHVQMVYYLAICLGVLFITFSIYKLKAKQFSQLGKTIGILLLFSLLAVGSNFSRLNTTYKYMKYTMRGPAILESTDTNTKVSQRGGLDYDYVFNWSHDAREIFTYFIPGFLGGSVNETISEESAFASDLIARGAPVEQATRAPLYWGNMPSTAGPTYFGAIIIFLFVIGLLTSSGYVRMWIAVVTVLFTFLSLGKNFAMFNDIMYYYFPMYNKFRSVNSSLAALQFTFPILAVLGLHNIFNGKQNLKDLNKKLYIALGTTGGLCLLFALIGPFLFDFTSSGDQRLQEYGYNIPKLIETRSSFLRKDSFRSFMLIALVFGIIWTFINEKIKLKKEYLYIAIAALIVFDMGMVGNRYLNSSKFVDKDENEEQYTTPRAVDIPILQDPDPNYRVFDASISIFNSNEASRYHKTIGGYNAAKLRRYQDMIEKHIGTGNMNVLNMMNTKYFIQKNDQGQQFQQRNPNNLGNCWFVDSIKTVTSNNEEIDALKNFNPAKTAYVHQEFKEQLNNVQPVNNDSGTIRQTKYGLNELEYTCDIPSNKLAIFSEVWYASGKEGWQAYIDEKPVEHIRANYILRALPIRAGKHKIRFEFKPWYFFFGEKISLSVSILLIIICFSLIGLHFRSSLTSKSMRNESN